MAILRKREMGRNSLVEEKRFSFSVPLWLLHHDIWFSYKQQVGRETLPARLPPLPTVLISPSEPPDVDHFDPSLFFFFFLFFLSVCVSDWTQKCCCQWGYVARSSKVGRPRSVAMETNRSESNGKKNLIAETHRFTPVVTR